MNVGDLVIVHLGKRSGQPYPAIVTRVKSTGMVDIVVFGRTDTEPAKLIYNCDPGTLELLVVV
jgi:hypothetical protein